MGPLGEKEGRQTIRRADLKVSLLRLLPRLRGERLVKFMQHLLWLVGVGMVTSSGCVRFVDAPPRKEGNNHEDLPL